MKVRHILMSTLALSLLALGVNAATAHANSFTSYNKPKNALTSYMHLGHFKMINNANYTVNHFYNNQNVNPNRQLNTVGGNWKDSYRPYAVLNDSRTSYNPQSVVIKPDGTTFVSYDVGNHNTQLVKYNINNTYINDDGDQELANPDYGPVFKGAHGQSMAWNPKTNQLWLQYNTGSATNNVTMLLINQHTLKPMHQLKFNFEPYPFGNALAFDNKGNAYTGTDTFTNSSHRGAPVGSFKIYKGALSYGHANFHMIPGLRHTPGTTIQNMIFNPANQRMYVLADGNYVSFPTNQKVTSRNVHSTKLNKSYEPEDLAFYKGHTYLLLHYPSQLMISTNDDASHGNYKVVARHGKKATKRNHVRKVRKNNHKKSVRKSKRTTKRNHKRNVAKRSKKNRKAVKKAAKSQNKKRNSKKANRKGRKTAHKNNRRHGRK